MNINESDIQLVLEEVLNLGLDKTKEIKVLAQKIIDMSITCNSNKYLANAHNFLGNVYWQESNYEKAKEHYEIQKNFT